MNTRRQFITTVAGAAAVSSKASGADEPKPEIRYSMNPKPPKIGPHTGTLDVFVQNLKPRGERPLSFLKDEHADLATWKSKARAKMLELFHYTPEKCDPQAEVISRKDCGDYIREEIRFNTTPVFRVPGTVLIPKGLTKPAPAVVLLHSHGGYYLWGRERELEGDDVHPTLIEMRESYGKKAIGTEMVRRGYVVISIDMFFWGERRMVLEDDPPEWKERPAGISSESVVKFNQRSNASEQLMGRTLLSAGVTWSGILGWDARTGDRWPLLLYRVRPRPALAQHTVRTAAHPRRHQMGRRSDADRTEGKLSMKHLLTLITVLLFMHLTHAEPSAGLMQRILKPATAASPAR